MQDALLVDIGHCATESSIPYNSTQTWPVPLPIGRMCGIWGTVCDNESTQDSALAKPLKAYPHKRTHKRMLSPHAPGAFPHLFLVPGMKFVTAPGGARLVLKSGEICKSHWWIVVQEWGARRTAGQGSTFWLPHDRHKPRGSPCGGNEQPLGLSLFWGSQKVEPCGWMHC